jgi:predicted nuclease of predicted toxin-antitoxin system
VVHLGLEHADDAALWAAARHDGYALVTKDTDFHDESRFPGPPPKVLHVALGNGPTSSVEAALRNSQVSILRFSSDDRRLMVLR